MSEKIKEPFSYTVSSLVENYYMAFPDIHATPKWVTSHQSYIINYELLGENNAESLMRILTESGLGGFGFLMRFLKAGNSLLQELPDEEIRLGLYSTGQKKIAALKTEWFHHLY